MSKYSEKVIPTLDDVIKRGEVDDTPVGDLSTLEDDFEEDFSKFFQDDNDDQTSKDTSEITDEPAVAEIETDENLDFDGSITSQIMAERFPADDNSNQETPQPTPEETLTVDDNSGKNETAPAETQTATVTDTIPEPAITSKPKIEIGELVNEITRQLMPEIEWKVRTQVREVLERHFPDSD